MTEPDALQQVNRTFVLWKNRRYSYFGGCDYFRLASHPAVLAAARAGLKKYGLSAAASRLTTGNHAIYAELEAALADFFRAPSAVIVSSGYSANSILAQALQGSFSRVLIDEKAHGSLHEAARQFRCLIETFQHLDAADLGRVLDRTTARDKPIVLTDGVMADTGEVAPLADYLARLPAHGMILVDDAHGAGVLGANGRGTPEHAGVAPERVLQTISLSKAFGVFGGAILCARNLREKIMRHSPIIAGSTPLPPPLANAALQSLALLRAKPGFRLRLEKITRAMKSALRARGFPVVDSPAPIIAFAPASPARAAALRRALVSRKIFPCFIRYPGGPPEGFFRFALSSRHSRAQLDDLLAALTAK